MNRQPITHRFSATARLRSQVALRRIHFVSHYDVKMKASTERFVIKLRSDAAAAVRAALATLGSVDPLEGSDLQVVNIAGAGDDPKAAWRTILQRAPSAEWAAPLIEGEQRGSGFPTGEITVRFAHSPSDVELRSFAAAHGLSVQKRNEFVAEQVVFRPRDPRSTYLPDVIDAISSATDVVRVWANTLSRYEKS